MSSKRDAIRAATVGAQKRFRSEVVTVNGQEIEIREPNLATRDLIESKKGESAEAAGWARVCLQIIYMCFEPGTETRIYEHEDLDSLMGCAASGWVNDLGLHCARLYFGVMSEDPVKNSGGTIGDTTSS